MSDTTIAFITGMICGAAIGWGLLLIIAMIVELVRVWRSF